MGEYALSRESSDTWSWLVFAAVLAIAVLLNLGQGVFQQIEEILLLSENARGQTTPIEIGWPFHIVSAYAYTTEFVIDETPLVTIARCFADFVLTSIFIYAGTRYVSAMARSCHWKFDLLCAITLLTLFAVLLARGRSLFWYHNSVGAFSYALFRCVDAVEILGTAFSIHWLFTQIGRLVTVLKPPATRSSDTVG